MWFVNGRLQILVLLFYHCSDIAVLENQTSALSTLMKTPRWGCSRAELVQTQSGNPRLWCVAPRPARSRYRCPCKKRTRPDQRLPERVQNSPKNPDAGPRQG